MTLGQLLRGTTIQANVRLAVFDDRLGGDEIIVYCFEDLETSYPVIDLAKRCKLLSKKVSYLFCPGDGYLHIEVVLED